jgi:hypothetical protein
MKPRRKRGYRLWDAFEGAFWHLRGRRQEGIDEFDVGGAGGVLGAVQFVEAEVAFVSQLAHARPSFSSALTKSR